jgi:hypothetical protein
VLTYLGLFLPISSQPCSSSSSSSSSNSFNTRYGGVNLRWSRCCGVTHHHALLLSDVCDTWRLAVLQRLQSHLVICNNDDEVWLLARLQCWDGHIQWLDEAGWLHLACKRTPQCVIGGCSGNQGVCMLLGQGPEKSCWRRSNTRSAASYVTTSSYLHKIVHGSMIICVICQLREQSIAALGRIDRALAATLHAPDTASASPTATTNLSSTLMVAVCYAMVSAAHVRQAVQKQYSAQFLEEQQN